MKKPPSAEQVRDRETLVMLFWAAYMDGFEYAFKHKGRKTITRYMISKRGERFRRRVINATLRNLQKLPTDEQKRFAERHLRARADASGTQCKEGE